MKEFMEFAKTFAKKRLIFAETKKGSIKITSGLFPIPTLLGLDSSSNKFQYAYSDL